MIIYFTGIDGSGKSTIIKELEARKIFGSNYVAIRGGYVVKLIKPFSNLVRNKKVKSSTNYNYISKSDYNNWKSFKKKLLDVPFINNFLYAFQSFDYYLQIIKLEREFLNKNITVVLDRYIYDYLTGQNIYYGDKRGNFWYKILMKKLAAVNYMFFIDIDCRTAFSRKDDIPSIEFLEERKQCYVNAIKDQDNSYIIDNNGSIDNTISQIVNILPNTNNT